MTTKTTDKTHLAELRSLTKDKTNWQTAIADVATMLGEPYLEKLQWVAEHDAHPVVRIHTSGAIRITEKALAEAIGGY